MDYVFLIASAAIIVTCMYFIVSPFFISKKEDADGVREENEMPALETVYATVNELEMDYLMKKIKEEDFKILKEKYQSLAIEFMNQEKKSMTRKSDRNSTEKAELEILDELRKLRSQKGR